MSRVIKASRIIGEYKLENVEVTPQNIEDEGETHPGDEPEPEELSPEQKEIIARAEAEAEEIVERAENRAEEIRTEARKEAEEVKDDAYEEGHKEGYEEGYREGYGEGEEKLAEALLTVRKAAEKVGREIEKEKEKLPGEVIELATKIARRIINTQIEINPEFINNIITDMLAEIGNNHERITIRVKPDLLQYINEVEIDSAVNGQQIDFTGDPALEAGDCIIDTEYGGRDGTLERKLSLLEKELYKGAGSNDGVKSEQAK